MREFARFLVEKAVTQLTIWRADIDFESDCTEPWVIQIAEEFLNGTLAPPHGMMNTKTLKSDDSIATDLQASHQKSDDHSVENDRGQPTIGTHAFMLKWTSEVGADVGVFAFTLSVREAATAAAVPFETGLVWRENTTVRGAAACCGNATWALGAGKTYEWTVNEFEGADARPVGATKTKHFTMAADLPTPRQEAQRETFSFATNRVYNREQRIGGSGGSLEPPGPLS
jgi:hypothetical protein